MGEQKQRFYARGCTNFLRFDEIACRVTSQDLEIIGIKAEQKRYRTPFFAIKREIDQAR